MPELGVSQLINPKVKESKYYNIILDQCNDATHNTCMYLSPSCQHTMRKTQLLYLMLRKACYFYKIAIENSSLFIMTHNKNDEPIKLKLPINLIGLNILIGYNSCAQFYN